MIEYYRAKTIQEISCGNSIVVAIITRDLLKHKRFIYAFMLASRMNLSQFNLLLPILIQNADV